MLWIYVANMHVWKIGNWGKKFGETHTFTKLGIFRVNYSQLDNEPFGKGKYLIINAYDNARVLGCWRWNLMSCLRFQGVCFKINVFEGSEGSNERWCWTKMMSKAGVCGDRDGDEESPVHLAPCSWKSMNHGEGVKSSQVPRLTWGFCRRTWLNCIFLSSLYMHVLHTASASTRAFQLHPHFSWKCICVGLFHSTSVLFCEIGGDGVHQMD